MENNWDCGDKGYFQSYISLPSVNEIDNVYDIRSIAEQTARYGAVSDGTVSNITAPRTVINNTVNAYCSNNADSWRNVEFNTNMALHFTFYVTSDFFRNRKIDVATMGENVKTAIKASAHRFELGEIYSDAELDAIGFGEESYSNSTTKFMAGDNKYVLLGTRTNAAGETEYQIMAENSRAEKLKLNFDASKGFTYDGTALDEYIDSDLPEFKDYMADTQWSYGDGSIAATTSKVSLPSKAEITGNADARAIIKNTITARPNGTDVTASRNMWNEGTYYVYYAFSNGKEDGSNAIGFTNETVKPEVHFTFYVSKDFFANTVVKNYDGTSIVLGSDEVKKAIAKAAGLKTMTRLYGEAAAKVLKTYAEERTPVAGSSFGVDGAGYVMLGMRTNSTGKKEYLIMPKANYGAGIGNITYTDADGMMYKGKKLDEYMDNYAKFKPYMVRNVWNMDEGKTMTSYMCLPSTGERKGNADALAVMSSQSGSYAYGTDMTVTRQFYKQGNNMFLYRYSGKAKPKTDVTRLSNTDGTLANTQTLALNFAFYVTDDFFENVHLDVNNMGTSLREIIVSNIND